MGTQMTVLRLADGSLWLHSPIKFDDSLKRAFDSSNGSRRHCRKYPGTTALRPRGNPGRGADVDLALGRSTMR